MEAPNIDVWMVDDWNAWQDLCGLVGKSKYDVLAIDLETDSVQERKANIYGIGLAFTDAEAFYIPIRKPTGEPCWSLDQQATIYKFISIWCRNHKLIGHNAIFDTLVFEYRTGHRISDFLYADTILMKHLLDEERPFGLKECAVKYLGAWADKAQQRLFDDIHKNGGKTTKAEMEMHKASTDVLGEYCAWDVVLTRRLYNLFLPRLKEEGLEGLFFQDEVMPLYHVTINMKRQGFHIDVPYFEKLRTTINKDIARLEDEIMNAIKSEIGPFEQRLLDKECPYKRTGSFPKAAADYYGISLPTGPKGAPTLARRVIEHAAIETPGLFYDWLLGRAELAPSSIQAIQRKLFQTKYERQYIFNLRSNDHLGWLLFEHLGEEPAARTETGKAQIDEDYLATLQGCYPWVALLIDLKKLNKLCSTYIDGILEQHIDGIIYSSMLMFGTTSGRYSSTKPNCQNLPREKEDDSDISPIVRHYGNAIKRGFVAPKGYKIVNADYSALEPRCFADVSKDETLRGVFRKGLDLYSQIAIDVFGLQDCSADPKAPNYLKIKYPEKRQLAKIFALAVVYGAEAGRIAESLGIGYKQAESIIEAYLNAYPGLRDYMSSCDLAVKDKGYVSTAYGRVRHLFEARGVYLRYGERLLDRRWAKTNDLGQSRYVVKNALNLAKNHPIQGLAAHIVNRAMIRTQALFKDNDIDGAIVMTVHDEICCVIKENQSKKGALLLQEAMEHTVELSLPLKAEPLIADNWGDAK